VVSQAVTVNAAVMTNNMLRTRIEVFIYYSLQTSGKHSGVHLNAE
jgi:hypothetical protein